MTVYDPRSYGAVVDGVTNDHGAIQAAINAASGAGGGTVLLPGRCFIASGLGWADKVSLVGYGAGASVLIMGPSCTSAIEYGFTANAPGTDITFSGFLVDGSASAVTAKAIYITHMLRATFYRVVAYNTPTTGLGCDFLTDTKFIECVAIGCGRLGTTSSPGCSGFGIGTGATPNETCELIDCVAIGNMRYGAFFENQQTGNPSMGAKVTRGTFNGNYRGIGDNGNDGMTVVGARAIGNTLSGYFAGQESAGITARNGLVNGCLFADSGYGAVYQDNAVNCGIKNTVLLNNASGDIYRTGAVNLSESANQVFTNAQRVAAYAAAFAIRPPSTGLDY